MAFAPEYINCVLSENFEDAKEQFLSPLIAIHTAHLVMLAARGIRVPEELSILGYDGIMESTITFPPLTTIRQPIHEMGELAARTLLTQIRQPGAPAQQIVLENSLLLRESTAAPKYELAL